MYIEGESKFTCKKSDGIGVVVVMNETSLSIRRNDGRRRRHQKPFSIHSIREQLVSSRPLAVIGKKLNRPLC